MSLMKEAYRVAAEFDYPAEEVNKGVKEFIREMGMCKTYSATMDMTC